VRQLWQSGGVCGAMMRQRYPQPVTAPLCVNRAAGGRGKYGKQNRNQIQWAGSVVLDAAGPTYSCGFDNSTHKFKLWINRKFFN